MIATGVFMKCLRRVRGGFGLCSIWYSDNPARIYLGEEPLFSIPKKYLRPHAIKNADGSLMERGYLGIIKALEGRRFISHMQGEKVLRLVKRAEVGFIV